MYGVLYSRSEIPFFCLDEDATRWVKGHLSQKCPMVLYRSTEDAYRVRLHGSVLKERMLQVMRIRARPFETMAQKGAPVVDQKPQAAHLDFPRLPGCGHVQHATRSFPRFLVGSSTGPTTPSTTGYSETPYEKVVQAHLDVTTASRKRLPARPLTGKRVLHAVYLTTPNPLFIPARVLVQFGLVFDSPRGITRPLSNLARAPPRWTRPPPPCRASTEIIREASNPWQTPQSTTVSLVGGCNPAPGVTR